MLKYPVVNNHDDLTRAVDLILEEVGLKREDQGGKLTFTGLDPVRPTHLKVGSASAAILAANSIATSIIWRKRTGEGQDVHIDMRKSFAVQSPWQDILLDKTKINGVPQTFHGMVGQLGSHLLQTRDGKWVILTSLYESNTLRIAALLDSGILPHQLENAVRKWDSADLERAAQDAGIPLVICRTPEEFNASEQGQHLLATPLIEIEKIGDSPAEPLPQGPRPLSGLRVLGMTHVVAGPTIMRQLSAQGADCLNLNTITFVEQPTIYWQSFAGSRQAYLDARIGSKTKGPIYELAKEADVFVQNIQPGMVAKQGFSPETLAQYRPGIIAADVTLAGRKGPMAGYKGYDFTAGGLTGLFTAIGSEDAPQLTNAVNVVCDFLTGYLASIGIQAALLRRAEEGGSYRVSVNLAQTVMFQMALGLVANDTLLQLDSGQLGDDHKPQEPNLQTGPTAFGEFTRLGSQVDMSKTPEFWADPLINPIGSSKPEWLPREAQATKKK